MSELIECLDGLRAEDIIRRIAKTANGQPFYLQTKGLSSTTFCATYQTIYDAFATPPSDAIAAAQNTMVCGLVDDGVWAKLDTFWMFAQTNGIDALLNWVNPAFFTCINNHATAFTPLEGFLGDGNFDYLNTTWDSFNNGVNYTQNSASFGGYCRTDLSIARHLMAASGAAWLNGMSIIMWQPGNLGFVRMNTNNLSDFGTTTSSLGMWIANRTAANVHDLYQNKVQKINGTDASNGLTDKDLYLLAYNSNGVASNQTTYQISMAYTGGGFTQGDIGNLTDRFETYMDSNGKGVIP